MQKLTKQPLFDLGQLVATPGALSALEKTGQNAMEFLSPYVKATGENCPKRTRTRINSAWNEASVFSAAIALPLATKKAGIIDVTWHTLRHTFASRLLNRGVNIVAVQQLLGHSAITVTTRYTHTNLESKHAAVAKLEKFGDNLVTVCTKMQQSSSQLSLNAL